MKRIITILLFWTWINGYTQLPDFPRPGGIYTKGTAQPGQFLNGI